MVVAKNSYSSDGTSRSYGSRGFVEADADLLEAVRRASLKSGVAVRAVKNGSHDTVYRAFRPRKSLRIQTADLETSGVYSIAASLGARAVSILGVVCGQGDEDEVVKRYAMDSETIIRMEESEIRLALEATCLFPSP